MYWHPVGEEQRAASSYERRRIRVARSTWSAPAVHTTRTSRPRPPWRPRVRRRPHLFRPRDPRVSVDRARAIQSFSRRRGNLSVWFCQGSRHCPWPTRAWVGIGPPLTKGADKDAVLGLWVGS